jgi:hypothetical protein
MAVDIVLNPPSWNASISYVKPGAVKSKNTLRVLRFYLMELEQPHLLGGSVHQSKLYSHFYARSYSPGQVQVKGRVRTQSAYDTMATFIRDHQKLMVTQPGRSNSSATDAISLMTLSIKDENLYYAGWIPSFQGGAKRFNPAPPIDFSFEVIHDKHSTANKIIPSAAKRVVWSGTFLTGAFVPDPKVKEPAFVPFTPGIDGDGEGGRGGV